FLWKKYIALVKRDFSKKYKAAVFRQAINQKITKEDAENMIYSDIPLLENNYIEAWLRFIYCIWFSSVSLIYVLTISWQVSLVFITFSAIPTILPRFFAKMLKEKNRDWSQANETFIKEINEDLTATDVIKHYQKVAYFSQRFLKALETREEQNYQNVVLADRVTFIINIFAVIAGILPFGIGGFLAIRGYLSVGGLVAVFLASDRVLSPIENAVRHWNDIQSTVFVRQKIEQMISKKQDKAVKKHPEKSIFEGKHIVISFQDVAFGYDNPLFTLTDQLESRDKVLINGPSGSGKTTLFKTLFGEIDKLKGNLLINHKPIEEIENTELYTHIGYIPQEIILFDDSIFFNITLGDDYSQAAVKDAIDQAGLTALVAVKGFDYKVGVNGKHLSGGERARITVARALLRQYKILLVDEFSSSLDKQTAKAIREVLLNTDTMILEIAHHYDEEQIKNYTKVWSLGKR
ncbi:ABC transporter ATP-binding protein, partial [Streptococcus merionis]|uniref:ATP-binding cassette domain-containing protein n=1 Tax=Streptococcus merionis TaxID=400065 RepID=UPI0026EB666A